MFDVYYKKNGLKLFIENKVHYYNGVNVRESRSRALLNDMRRTHNSLHGLLHKLKLDSSTTES